MLGLGCNSWTKCAIVGRDTKKWTPARQFGKRAALATATAEPTVVSKQGGLVFLIMKT